jgi:catechol 2,3-dioxygenase-like lactoylglutathione lyase family enzyme
MFEKFDHINLTVKNLTESIDWYAKIFGFEKMESGTAMGSPYAIVGFNDFMLCMYEEQDRQSAQKMGDAPFHQIYHFGIRVKDEDAWRAAIAKHQLKIQYGGEIAYPRSISWYILDPSGHEIEVSYTQKGLWGK